MRTRLAQKIMNTCYRYMCEIVNRMPYSKFQRDNARKKMFDVYKRNKTL